MLDQGISQTSMNKRGEIKYRQMVAFGEPDKVLSLCKTRINERSNLFKKIKMYNFDFSPFLEIGTERGQIPLYLVNEDGDYGVGIDLSLDSLKVSKNIKKYMGYERTASFICGDALRLPFHDRSFNFVFCFQTLHHFASLGPIFDEIIRVLKDNGYFFFAEEGCRDNIDVKLWPDINRVIELKYDIIENAFTREIWDKEISKFKAIFVEHTSLYEGYEHISALLRKL